MPPSRSKTLTVLDPTSLLGREVTEGLARALPDVRRRLFHTGAQPEHLIAEIAGEAALVPPLADPEELEGSAAVLVTAPVPAEARERLLGWLRAHGEVALLDCAQPGLAGSEARCVAGAPPAPLPERRWFHLADPALAAPLRLLAALAPLRPQALHLTVASPVAALGADAIDELAAQGAARLSGQPMRALDRLPAALAFDLAPSPGDRSRELEAQIAELHPGLECRVHAIEAGVFHGYLATVSVRCASGAPHDRVRALLRDAAGFRVARRNEILTVTDVVEHGSPIVCGDVQTASGWASAWLLADGVALGGTHAALEFAAAVTGW